LLTVGSFWLLVLVHLAQAAALTPVTSIADALAVNSADRRNGRRGFEYGWVRGSASAAFVVGTLIAGQLLGFTELSALVWTHALLLAVAIGATALVPRLEAQPGPQPQMSSFLGGARELWKLPIFRRLVLVAALVYGSHAIHDAFAMIRWNDAGVGPGTTSLLWSEAVVAEVIVFLVIGPTLVNRLGPNGAAVLAAAAGVVRWLVVGQTTSVVALAIVQPLHGFTFALLHLACMRLIGIVVPVRLAATAQALYALGAGLATMSLTLLSGRFYAAYGGAAFLPMAMLCGLAMPLAWFGLRHPNRPSLP
jgi:MFS transporter, PPP family, 3-phenylpropionic acid transporter